MALVNLPSTVVNYYDVLNKPQSKLNWKNRNKQYIITNSINDWILCSCILHESQNGCIRVEIIQYSRVYLHI